MNATQTLGALIRDRQASTGWSLRDLSDRSPSGAGLNKDRWGELRRDEAKTFSGAQLRGIADALGIPESIVGRAALATMGVTARDGNAARVEDAVRTDNELSEHDRRILLAVLREMRMERGGNADSTAPITHAGESPATDQERRERPAEESSLEWVVNGKLSSEQPAVERVDQERREHPTGDLHMDELSTSPRGARRAATERAGEDELARRRREREAAPSVVDGSDTAEVPGQAEIPVPDELLMAGYDEPQESILAREQQDADAEGPQG